jgi:hypothetical protein
MKQYLVAFLIFIIAFPVGFGMSYLINIAGWLGKGSAHDMGFGNLFLCICLVLILALCVIIFLFYSNKIILTIALVIIIAVLGLLIRWW